MESCNFKTLHIDPKNGYVLQCTHCGRITIGFGIITVSRTLPEFYKFVHDTHSCYQHYAATGQNPKIRNIPFWQLSSYSCLTMSLNDLSRLGELLDFAVGKLYIDQFISTLPTNQN
ncbi:hypothetical protein [Arsenicibacter rosenii]|uniref:Uncharacterized protein n=1 Tax=Arsenicibacter rosenii TaxID=1750698 RepID=A0A1S2VR03_9BACT|nr:hypothetical protein [Arsenicibacter rosenii]OIN60820.1 hypothetical protein BLX24_01610 [Arsenicibacter rosenii]